jgi:hypothetical protein
MDSAAWSKQSLLSASFDLEIAVNFQRANFNNNLVATVSNGKPELLRII